MTDMKKSSINGISTLISGPIGYELRGRCKEAHVTASSIATQILGKAIRGEKIGSFSQELTEYQAKLTTQKNTKARLQTAYNTIERIGGMDAAKRKLNN